jgi:hypothetical protein
MGKWHGRKTGSVYGYIVHRYVPPTIYVMRGTHSTRVPPERLFDWQSPVFLCRTSRSRVSRIRRLHCSIYTCSRSVHCDALEYLISYDIIYYNISIFQQNEIPLSCTRPGWQHLGEHQEFRTTRVLFYIFLWRPTFDVDTEKIYYIKIYCFLRVQIKRSLYIGYKVTISKLIAYIIKWY